MFTAAVYFCPWSSVNSAQRDDGIFAIYSGELKQVNPPVNGMKNFERDVNSAFGTYAPSPLQRVILAVTKVPPLYRGRARPFWCRLLNRFRPGPIDAVTIHGKFRVYPMTNLVDSALLLHSGYNAQELAFLRRALPEDGVFVDLGANIGLYSIAMGNALSPRAKVIAVEANQICAEQLRWHCQINGLANCTVFELAVGDSEGRARLNMLKNDLAIVNTVRDDVGGDVEVKPLLKILEQTGIERIELSGMPSPISRLKKNFRRFIALPHRSRRVTSGGPDAPNVLREQHLLRCYRRSLPTTHQPQKGDAERGQEERGSIREPLISRESRDVPLGEGRSDRRAVG